MQMKDIYLELLETLLIHKKCIKSYGKKIAEELIFAGCEVLVDKNK